MAPRASCSVMLALLVAHAAALSRQVPQATVGAFPEAGAGAVPEGMLGAEPEATADAFPLSMGDAAPEAVAGALPQDAMGAQAGAGAVPESMFGAVPEATPDAFPLSMDEAAPAPEAAAGALPQDATGAVPQADAEAVPQGMMDAVPDATAGMLPQAAGDAALAPEATLAAASAAALPRAGSGACTASEKSLLDGYDAIRQKITGEVLTQSMVMPTVPPPACSQDLLWPNEISHAAQKTCYEAYGLTPAVALCHANNEVWKVDNCKKICIGKMLSEECVKCQENNVDEMYQCVGAAMGVSAACQSCRADSQKYHYQNCQVPCHDWYDPVKGKDCGKCNEVVDSMRSSCY